MPKNQPVKKRIIISFKERYRVQPTSMLLPLRTIITERCEWSMKTFYRKMDDESLLSQLEKEALCEIFKCTLKEMFKDNKKSPDKNYLYRHKIK